MLYGHGRGCGEARWSRRAVWQHQVLTGLQSGSKGSRRRCVKGEERRGTSSQKSSTGPAAETERVSENRRCSHLCSSVIIASIVCIRLEHLQEPRDGVKVKETMEAYSAKRRASPEGRDEGCKRRFFL